MLNYEVEPSLLNPYVPPGTTLDSFNGRTYVSLVGFRFCRTKLLGFFPVPFHSDFDEVNLRFYVRRKEGGDDRRGVVFIAEVVPRRAIATTARLVFGENYTCLPMKHRIETEGLNRTAEYQWQVGGQWCGLSARTVGLPTRPQEGGWNSSSPNTTGDIRLNEPAVASNIMCPMYLGKCGRPIGVGLKAMPALFMDANSRASCNNLQSARSSRMAPPSPSSQATEFNESVRPRIRI
jgi:Uncharacterized conserved protein (COG2071)